MVRHHHHDDTAAADQQPTLTRLTGFPDLLLWSHVKRDEQFGLQNSTLDLD